MNFRLRRNLTIVCEFKKSFEDIVADYYWIVIGYCERRVCESWKNSFSGVIVDFFLVCLTNLTGFCYCCLLVFWLKIFAIVIVILLSSLLSSTGLKLCLDEIFEFSVCLA